MGQGQMMGWVLSGLVRVDGVRGSAQFSAKNENFQN